MPNNFFDRFDDQPEPRPPGVRRKANFFDRFDEVAAAPKDNPAALGDYEPLPDLMPEYDENGKVLRRTPFAPKIERKGYLSELGSIISSAFERGSASTLATGLHAGSDFIDQTIQAPLRRTLGALGLPGFDDPLGAAGVAEQSMGVEREINAERQQVQQEIGGRPTLRELVANPIESARRYSLHLANAGAESLPAFAGAIALRKPELAAGALGGVTGAQTYTDLRAEGVGRGDASLAALANAGIETAGEALGLPFVMGKAGRGSLLKAMLAEGGQEAPVSLAQQYVEDRTTGKQTPILQQLGDALDAGLVGAGLGAGGHGLSVGVDRLTGNHVPQPTQAPNAAPREAPAEVEITGGVPATLGDLANDQAVVEAFRAKQALGVPADAPVSSAIDPALLAAGNAGLAVAPEPTADLDALIDAQLLRNVPELGTASDPDLQAAGEAAFSDPAIAAALGLPESAASLPTAPPPPVEVAAPQTLPELGGVDGPLPQRPELAAGRGAGDAAVLADLRQDQAGSGAGQAIGQPGEAGTGPDPRSDAAAGAQAPAIEMPTMQNRDRSRAASVSQMQDIRRNPDPERLGFSRDPNTGAPMVGAGKPVPDADKGRTDTVVMASGRRVPVQYAVVEADELEASHDADGRTNPGYDAAPLKALNNGRTAGLQAAYASGNTDAYRQGITADAGLHGVSAEAIANKRSPVLVRLYDPAQNTGDIGAESNATQQLGLSPVEQAQTDARALPDLAGMNWNEDGSISPTGNANFFRAWFANIGGTQAASLQDAHGRPNAAALQRVRAAMVQRAYGDERLLVALAEDVNPDNRNVLAALTQAAPAFAKLDAAALPSEIRNAVVGGLELLRDASARGLSLRDAIAQGDLLGRNPDADAVAQFMADNARSAKRMADAFRVMAEYAADAEAQSATLDVFGSAPTPTVSGALSRAGVANDRIAEPAGRAEEGRRVGEQAEGERAAAGDAFGLSAQAAQVPAAQEVRPASGLFGAPTARDVVDAAARDRDAKRDGKAGTGRTDMLAGDGDLFAGPRPEQADIETGELPAQDVSTYGETRPLSPGPERGRVESPAGPDAAGRRAAAALRGQFDLFVATRGQQQPGRGHEPAVKVNRPKLSQAVGLAQIGQFRSGHAVVDSLAKAAHILAPLRKSAQEQFLALVLDADGRPLGAIRHTVGLIASSEVDPGTVFGAIASIPGAKRVVFGHNHPSGNLQSSAGDRSVDANLRRLMKGSGIEIMGAIIVAPGQRKFTAYHADYSDTMTDPIAAAGTTRLQVPSLERRYTKLPPASGRASLSDPAAGRRLVREQADGKYPSGVILLDTRHNVIGTVGMSRGDMKPLRTGDPGTGIADLARRVSGANAAAAVVYGPSASDRELENTASALKALGLRVLDKFHVEQDGGEPVSMAAKGVSVGVGAFESVEDPGPPARRKDDTANATLAREQSIEGGIEDADAGGLRDAVHAAVGNAPVSIRYLRGMAGLSSIAKPGYVRDLEARQAERGGDLRTAGLFLRAEDTQDGTPHVVIFTDVKGDAAGAAFVAAHEVAGHYGLRTMLGDKLNRVLALAEQNQTVKALADAILKKRKMPKSERLRSVEEALAELAAANRTGDWQRIADTYGVKPTDTMKSRARAMLDAVVARLRGLLNKALGRQNVEFTDGQVRQLLENAWQAAQGNASSMSIIVPNGALEQVVFHGTPHTVDKFSLQKIGTGEGAQAYGWGMYFASMREVADGYRVALTADQNRRQFAVAAAIASSKWFKPGLVVNGKKYYDRMELQGDIDRRDLTSFDMPADVAKVFTEKLAEPSGNLYRVDVPEDADLLDWDKPLSEQPEKVREALERAGIVNFAENIGPSPTGEIRNLGWAKNVEAMRGEEIYRRLIEREFTVDKGATTEARKGSERAASEALMAAGIPGLRYLDGTSRTKGEGSANYVIWDESAIGTPSSALESKEAGPFGPIYDNADFEAGIDALLRDKTGEIRDGMFHPSIGPVDVIYGEAGTPARNYEDGYGLAKIAAKHPEVYLHNLADQLLRAGDPVIRGNTATFDTPEYTVVVKRDWKGSPKDWLLTAFEPKSAASGSTTIGAAATRSEARSGQDAAGRDSSMESTEDQTQSEAFRKWFGSSKVVDADGKPLVVYHGTAGNFDVFDGKKASTASMHATSFLGHFFSVSPDVANGFVPQKWDLKVWPNTVSPKDGGNVMPVHLSVANPYEMSIAEFRAMVPGGRSKEGVAAAEALRARLEREGYDGIHIPGDPALKDTMAGDEWSAETWVAFKPNQIKSATGNNGNFNPDNPSILESVEDVRNEAAASLDVDRGTAGWDYDNGEWIGRKAALAKARAALQDKMIAWRDAQGQIAEQGGIVDDAMNVYRLENLMHGRVQRGIENIEREQIEPLLKAMRDAGVTAETLELYLYARHAKERNARIAEINPRMPDGGSGMTDAEADAILQAADTARLDPLAGRVDRIIRSTRRRMLDHGLLSQEQFDALDGMYQHYVPLRGRITQPGEFDADLRRGGNVGGRGVDSRGKVVREALGRNSRAANLLGEIIGDTQRSVILAEKARVGRAAMRLVLANPNPDLWTVEPVQTERALNSAGEVYERIVNDWSDPSIIAVRHKGKLYKLQVTSPELARALNLVGVEQMNAVFRLGGKINRYFSAVLTKYNPAFIAANASRDAIFGLAGMAAEHGEAAALQAALKYPAAARAAWRLARGTSGTSQTDLYAQEFADAGGRTGYVAMPSVEDIAAKVNNVTYGGKAQQFKEAAQAVGDLVGAANDAVENALRLSAYITLRERGMAVDVAAEYAKNLTVNFNRKGEYGSHLNAALLFFNASMQGAHRAVKVLRHPKAMAYVGVLAAAQVIAAMAAMGMEDDDGEPLWNKVPDHVKRRNLVLVTPDGGIVTVPMPYGFNALVYAAGRTATGVLNMKRGDTSLTGTAADWTADVLSATLQAFVPIPVTEGASSFAPVPLQIANSIEANRDGLGHQIRRENPFAVGDVPRASMGKPDTMEVFKWGATALNRIGGGSEFTPPRIDMLDRAPEDLEYLLSEMTGGTGKFLVDVATLGGKLADPGAKVAARDVPITNRFVSNIDEFASQRSLYYDRKAVVDRNLRRVRNAFGDGSPEAVREAQALLDSLPGLQGATFKRRKKDSDAGPAGGIVTQQGSPQFEAKPGTVFAAFKAAGKAIDARGELVTSAYGDAPRFPWPTKGSHARNAEIRRADAALTENLREFTAAWSRDVVGAMD